MKPERPGYCVKVVYLDKTTANRAIRRLKNGGEWYWCEICEGYHVNKFGLTRKKNTENTTRR